MHPTHYRSRYRELSTWLKNYADHPDAKRIYKLAVRRKPRNYRAPNRPNLPRQKIFSESGNGGIERTKRRGLRYNRNARNLHAKIRRLVRLKRMTAAKNLLKKKRFRRLGRAHIDIGKMRIGSGWFYLGEDHRAFKIASHAARRSGKYYPLGHWYAGMAAYRSGRYINAADHFQSMAAIGGQSRWAQSAAAFWAARANLVARRPDRVSRWLGLAASHPRTFYGVLARRMLGVDSPLKWTTPKSAVVPGACGHPPPNRVSAPTSFQGRFFIDSGSLFDRFRDDFGDFFARYLVFFFNISTSFSQRFRR